jgi:hypothetical protein
MLWVTPLIALLLTRENPMDSIDQGFLICRDSGSACAAVVNTTPGDRLNSRLRRRSGISKRPSHDGCAERLVCRYPLAGDVRCDLGEDDDQLQ